MTTKEKIIDEALTLFSKKGYTEVYVGDIAAAVGIKTPSLYKHYKSKQDIFSSCMEKLQERMVKIQNDLLIPGTPKSEASYNTADTEKIIEFTVGLFLFYLKDDVASKFRKILMIERYRNPELNKIFEDFYLNGAIEYEEKIFSELIEHKVIKREDPHILAIRFYTPVFYLLLKYDMYPDKETEAVSELTTIIREFCETYKGSGSQKEQS